MSFSIEMQTAWDRKSRIKKDGLSVEDVQSFFDFLRGKSPEGVEVTKTYQPKLTDRTGFAVIWFLQEYMGIMPDRFELCNKCKEIVDSNEGTTYDEKTGKVTCWNCE